MGWHTGGGSGGGGGGGAVDSVNGQTGVVVLDPGDIGALGESDLLDNLLAVYPWEFVGTWFVAASYTLGQAVRLYDQDNALWHLWLVIDSDLANVGEPPSSLNGWFKIDEAPPVQLPALMRAQFSGPHPNVTADETNAIFHVTQNGSNGSFTITLEFDDGTSRSSDPIAWDNAEVDVQFQFDQGFGTGNTVVNGDAADFTVELIGVYLGVQPSAITFDDGSLTGNVTLATQTQNGSYNGIPAPLGTTIHGQGVSLTDGYVFVKIGLGNHDWREVPQDEFVGFIVDFLTDNSEIGGLEVGAVGDESRAFLAWADFGEGDNDMIGFFGSQFIRSTRDSRQLSLFAGWAPAVNDTVPDPIADPSTATAEDVANVANALIGNLVLLLRSLGTVGGMGLVKVFDPDD